MIENFKELKVGTGYLLSGQAFQAVISFAANLVLVRFLSPAEFGRFALILSITAIILCFCSLNIKTIIVRTAVEDYSDIRKDTLFSVACYETLLSSVILFLWFFISSKISGWEALLIFALVMRHWVNINIGFFERKMPFRRLALILSLIHI